MLGRYITAFTSGPAAHAFPALTAVCVPAAYASLGSGWLVMKTSGALQRRAVAWARRALWGTAAAFAAVSVASPLISQRIFDKWFSLPFVVLLAPIPLATLVLLLIAARALGRLPLRLEQGNEYGAWVPFACVVGVVQLGFYGLAYSLFPFLVMDRLTIWQAATARPNLWVTADRAAGKSLSRLPESIRIYSRPPRGGALAIPRGDDQTSAWNQSEPARHGRP